jgi:hypothetical protein
MKLTQAAGRRHAVGKMEPFVSEASLFEGEGIDCHRCHGELENESNGGLATDIAELWAVA